MTSAQRHGLISTLTGLAPVRGITATVSGLRRPARQPPTPPRPVAWWVPTCAALCSTLPTAGWLIADPLQPARYNPVRQTISILAGHAGVHRWIVTTALLLAGVSYLVTASGLTALRRSGRLGLALAGVSAIGIALCPEPARGTTFQHMAFTSVGAAAIAIWPALTAQRGPRACAVVGVPVAAVTTAVFMALLGWLFFEAQTDGQVGLAERVDTSVQAFWPFVVAVSLRRAARPARPGPVEVAPLEAAAVAARGDGRVSTEG